MTVAERRTFASKLREFIRSNGVTAWKIANVTGISNRIVNGFVHHGSCPRDPEHLERIAEAVGCRIAVVVNDDETA